MQFIDFLYFFTFKLPPITVASLLLSVHLKCFIEEQQIFSSDCVGPLYLTEILLITLLCLSYSQQYESVRKQHLKNFCRISMLKCLSFSCYSVSQSIKLNII